MKDPDQQICVLQARPNLASVMYIDIVVVAHTVYSKTFQ